MAKREKSDIHDVIIVGAGAAGLACARALHEAGIDALILEARDRIGGRILTVDVSDTNAVELGAEFIHGAHRETLQLLEEDKHPFEDLTDRHLFQEKHLSALPDFWKEVQKISALLNPAIKTDRSMKDFLVAHARRLNPTARDLYVSYIEGFQAADLHLAGERGMAKAENSKPPELNSQSQFRPLRGYTRVMTSLLHKADVSKSRLMLQIQLQKITIQKHLLDLQCLDTVTNRQKNLRCRSVVLTVPIGVLKKSIMFDPPLPAYEKNLATLQMGHVQRITFEFRERFWEKLSDHPVGFLHGDAKHHFPTWWTQMPRRSPFLTAWQGGPKAFEVSLWSEKARIEAALKSLSRITGKSSTFIRQNYVRHFTHDWSNDPYSLGGYSYVGIQQPGSSAKFAASYEGKIVLSGEGTIEGPERGTVSGALRSGHRAAMQIMKLLS